MAEGVDIAAGDFAKPVFAALGLVLGMGATGLVAGAVFFWMGTVVLWLWVEEVLSLEDLVSELKSISSINPRFEIPWLPTPLDCLLASVCPYA